jgi:hypothetical protein
MRTLAWLFLAAVGPALAQSADTKCGMADLICPKKGACEGECHKVCDRLGETFRAVRAATAELLKKETGVECVHTAGTCSATACGPCASVKENVYVPIFKERAESRLGKAVAHGDGPCTLVTGPLCAPCVNELSAAAAVRIQAFIQEKVGPTLAMAKAKVVARVKQAGLEPCACAASNTPCAECGEMKKKILSPLFRERMASGMAPHDGKPCALMSAEGCGPCADHIADAAWTMLQASKKK